MSCGCMGRDASRVETMHDSDSIDGTDPDHALEQIRELAAADPNGEARWEDLVGGRSQDDQDAWADVVSRLMDEGRVYEPILGRLKVV